MQSYNNKMDLRTFCLKNIHTHPSSTYFYPLQRTAEQPKPFSTPARAIRRKGYTGVEASRASFHKPIETSSFSPKRGLPSWNALPAKRGIQTAGPDLFLGQIHRIVSTFS